MRKKVQNFLFFAVLNHHHNQKSHRQPQNSFLMLKTSFSVVQSLFRLASSFNGRLMLLHVSVLKKKIIFVAVWQTSIITKSFRILKYLVPQSDIRLSKDCCPMPIDESIFFFMQNLWLLMKHVFWYTNDLQNVKSHGLYIL